MRTRMTILVLILSALIVPTASARAEDAAEALTRGKLETDLGNLAAAKEAFASVAETPGASEEQQWEALIRLGAALRKSGDLPGSAAAYETAWKRYRQDPEAVRFLALSLGSAVPDHDRWNQVWHEVHIEVDRTAPARPVVRVLWPGVPRQDLSSALRQRVTLDLLDRDYGDVFRLIADLSGMNVVVMPGTSGKISYRADDLPLGLVLEEVLAPYGLVAEIRDTVITIGAPKRLARRAADSVRRAFSGRVIDMEYSRANLTDVLRELAAHGGAKVEIPQGVDGRVTLKLVAVPWDQAFDLVCRTNGVQWRREGDLISVEPRSSGR